MLTVSIELFCCRVVLHIYIWMIHGAPKISSFIDYDSAAVRLTDLGILSVVIVFISVQHCWALLSSGWQMILLIDWWLIDWLIVLCPMWIFQYIFHFVCPSRYPSVTLFPRYLRFSQNCSLGWERWTDYVWGFKGHRSRSLVEGYTELDTV